MTRDDTRTECNRIHEVSRSKKSRLVSLFLSVFSFLLILGLSQTRFFEDVELRASDLKFRLRPRIPVREDILMIDIDDESLERFGRWPWPRSVMARLVDSLDRHGARNVFLDIEFIEPSRLLVSGSRDKESINREIGRLEGDVDRLLTQAFELVERGHSKEAVLPSLTGENGELKLRFKRLKELFDGVVEDPDQILAESLKQVGSTYLTFHFTDPGEKDKDDNFSSAGRTMLLRRFSIPRSQLGGSLPVPATGDLVPVIPSLTEAARGAGFANASPDQDGTFRRLPLFLPDADRLVFQGAFLLALDLMGVAPETLRLSGSQTLLLDREGAPAVRVPLDRRGLFLINWTGGWKTFKHVSAGQLLLSDELLRHQWALLIEADDGYLGGRLSQEVMVPFSMTALEQAKKIVIPALSELIERLREQRKSSPRFQDNPELSARASARLEALKSVVATFEKIETQRLKLIDNLRRSIAGSVCFVELSASGTTDIGVTPFDEKYPMAGTHATILNSLLTESFLKETHPGWTWLASFIMALILGWTLPFLGSRAATGIAITLMLGYGLAGGLLFWKPGLMIGTVAPVITVFLAYTLVTVYQRILTVKAFRLYRREKLVLERDLELAERIQRRLRPSSYPTAPGLDVAGRTRPARSLAGDFYAFFQLGEKRVACAIADISGKGLGAALLMNMIRSALKTIIATTGDNPEILATVNRLVGKEEIIQESSFATCQYLTFDLQEMNLSFSNAGHNPILLFRKGEQGNRELFISGVPIGIIQDSKYELVEEPLKAGDILVLFTDGISEAHDRDDNQFGMDRLNGVVAASRDGTAEEILSAVFDAVDEFASGTKQYDDMTAVVFKIRE